MEQKTALVTAIGSVAGDIVIKNLKKLGFRVIGCDIYAKEWLADAWAVDAFYQAPYATDTENYLGFMLALCRTESIDYILPLIDIEVDAFSAHRELFDALGVCLCISPSETLRICRDKYRFAAFVDEHFPVLTTIPTLFLRDAELPPCDFPVVCKPYNGRSSLNLHYIFDLDQWRGFTASADKDLYIVQPMIRGSRIVADVVCQGAGGPAAAVVRRELISTVNGCGTSVYVYRAPELEAQAAQLASLLGIMGCVNFEFLLDEDGVYHLIECNPRFSGGTEFTCLSGYDCVENHMRCFTGRAIETPRYGPNRYIARKYEEYVTAIDDEEKGARP